MNLNVLIVNIPKSSNSERRTGVRGIGNEPHTQRIWSAVKVLPLFQLTLLRKLRTNLTVVNPSVLNNSQPSESKHQKLRHSRSTPNSVSQSKVHCCAEGRDWNRQHRCAFPTKHVWRIRFKWHTPYVTTEVAMLDLVCAWPHIWD